MPQRMVGSPKGFHPTGVVGAFGSAIGAGYLWPKGRPIARRSRHRFIAGVRQLGVLGRWRVDERNHPAWASACGQTAAMMAKHGYLGPRKPYEGRYGLFNLYMRDPAMADPSVITEGLGANGR